MQHSATNTTTVRRTVCFAAIGLVAASLVGCASTRTGQSPRYRTIQASADGVSGRGLPLDQNGRIAYDKIGAAYGQPTGDALGVALHTAPAATDSGTRTTFVLERD